DQDVQQPKDRTPSPQQPLDRSSSLSPAPETGSPPPDSKNSPPQPPQTQDEPTAANMSDGDAAVDGTLTPLTDLSPAPDPDDGLEDKKEEEEGEEDYEQPNVSITSQEEKKPSLDKGGDQAQRSAHINGIPPSRSDHISPVRQPSTSATLHTQSSDALPSRPNQTPTSAGPSHSRAPSGEFSGPPMRPPSSASAGISGQAPSDLKVLRILELNAELFKVCLEFQVRGVPITESRFQQYAMRLQANLTWLAAAADQRPNNSNMALPTMEPPIAVEFAAMDRIYHIYADLPTIFAKDIARRQLMNTQHHGSPITPSTMTNGTLKRNRPDDLQDLASKRRDIGDNKSQSMQTPAVPSISISGAGSHTNHPGPFPPPNPSTISVSAAQGIPQSPRVSSPAMPPPSAAPSLPFGATEASIAASLRARDRDIQIQQAREQQLRQATQMQHIQAARHMSPPSTSPQAPQGVGGMPGGQPNSLAAFGPQAQQLLAILQNPNDPLMQYMIQQMPQFTSLPLQQQMQKLQMFQQQQQNQQTVTPQRNPQMGGMAPNPGMTTLSNGSLSSGGGGGPSPVSPLPQQTPVMPHQQQIPSQSPQNNMYPYNHQGQANTGMDPRIAGSNFTPQMAGNNLSANQQRQLMLMQQQLRNSNANMNAAPNMMSTQQAYAMAQRMAQAGPSQPGGGGSPMSAPAGDQFPALRSNSTIPGIARSARSPSDGIHSPMTPRTPSRLSQQPQMPPNDYSQAMMQNAHGGMPQNTGSFNPQVQNPNWPQSSQQPMQQQMGMVGGQVNGYSMSPPNSAGAGGGFFGAAPSSSIQNWQQHQQGMTGSYPNGQSMGQQHVQLDQGRPPHMSSAHLAQHMGPVGDNSGGAPGEYDIFNYNG
ncbi:hypothetical protein BU15DRAFT_43484, partial [Melanogaster broomeanus]